MPGSYRKQFPFLNADEDVPVTSNPLVQRVIGIALDAAKEAGAEYADLRFTHTRSRGYTLRAREETINWGMNPNVGDAEQISIGVRALVNGYWGFSSGPVWSEEECARLGSYATEQAQSNSLGKVREVSFIQIDNSINEWTMPVEIDPFSLHPHEAWDRLAGLAYYALSRPYCSNVIQLQANFVRQDKVFSSTDGSFLTQRRFTSSGSMALAYRDSENRQGDGGVEGLTVAGRGFELFDDNVVRPAIDRCLEEIAFNLKLPVKPLDVGRYEAVLDASTTAEMLRGTIGAASELDRALGYEANAGGTSYLNRPLDMIGNEVIGSKLISVECDRRERGGAATTRWDDEGVLPSRQKLITKGILSGYQTNREFGGWLGKNVNSADGRSSGNAFSPSGVDVPLTHTGNLTILPGEGVSDFDSMVKETENGIALKRANANMDFQQLNGMAIGSAYKIEKGKIVSRINSAAILFRSPELWKGIIEVGGPSSQIALGGFLAKGEPQQLSPNTVYAVPTRHEGLPFIDPRRKA